MENLFFQESVIFFLLISKIGYFWVGIKNISLSGNFFSSGVCKNCYRLKNWLFLGKYNDDGKLFFVVWLTDK